MVNWSQQTAKRSLQTISWSQQSVYFLWNDLQLGRLVPNAEINRPSTMCAYPLEKKWVKIKYILTYTVSMTLKLAQLTSKLLRKSGFRGICRVSHILFPHINTTYIIFICFIIWSILYIELVTFKTYQYSLNRFYFVLIFVSI